MGGKFHLKLNIGGRPIANKYREGKMKRTLKRELKVPEIAEMEPMGGSVGVFLLRSTQVKLVCSCGKGFGTCMGPCTVMRMNDFDEMPLINPS